MIFMVMSSDGGLLMVFVLPALHPEVDHWDDNLIFNGLLAFLSGRKV